MSVAGTATRSDGKRFRRRSQKPEALLPHIRELANSLSDCSESQLLSETRSVQLELFRCGTFATPEIIVAGVALATESLRRSHGVELYDVQLLAVLHLTQGRIAQMQTGEGKTFVAITAAAYFALSGRGVHVMTPNAYLAERDSREAEAALQPLGLTVGLTPEQGEPLAKRIAYDCDVTYGTGHEFGFDYLRDQLTLREQAKAPLGRRLLDQLSGSDTGERLTLQRGLMFGIVDEADSVMIDDAASPLVLSMAMPGTAPDLKAHQAAQRLSEHLQQDVHFRLDATSGRISLTSDGRSKIHDDNVDVPAQVLLRPWASYVEQALRAKYLFRRDVHYVVKEDEVRIVDQTTGRIFQDRSWQDGLHQAIEVREGLTVTPEKEALARITRQRFFRLYQNLCGMTGTAVGCEAEFEHVYRCQIADIPLHRPSARQILPARFFATRTSRLHAIADDVQRYHATGRPVLVGTQSITDSEAIAQQLSERGLAFHLLNGLQTAEEAEIVAQAGQHGAITIATNLAGRGTDINIPDAVQNAGGLHVIVAECQLSGRMDRQLVGRCARQGQPGSSQVFVSAEDSLIVRFGSWLGKAIQREAAVSGEADADFTKALIRLQKNAEKQQFFARAEMLRQDIARDSLFGVQSR